MMTVYSSGLSGCTGLKYSVCHAGGYTEWHTSTKGQIKSVKQHTDNSMKHWNVTKHKTLSKKVNVERVCYLFKHIDCTQRNRHQFQ